MRLGVDDTGGDGIPVVLLHGLTATRRYVVMGSSALERGGHRVVAYDARGHGTSEPAPDPGAYEYTDLASDLAGVLDDAGIERAVLAAPRWAPTRSCGSRSTRPSASPASWW
jgi:pimeloyl-ACP methyl ester carboxylesterase